jgi:hypothetical protein
MWILATSWTAVVLGLLAWNLLGQRERSFEIARTYARAAHEKDLTYRRWNALLGGVYARVTDEVQPNPYLDAPEREVTTPSGVTLTLINPAYMTRQVHEMAAAQNGVLAHITSLNPIRPANAPDAWETEALQTFENGAEEFSSIEQMEGRPYVRLMRPLRTEAGCLKCHAIQGYEVGDIRGGISVAVPAGDLLAAGRQNMASLSLGYGLVWLAGLVGIFLGGRSLRRHAANRERAEAEARQANRAKSAFLANMSHELRTPMNAIIGYSEMLMEDAEDEGNEEVAGDLKKIRSAGAHLLALINDILDLSKIEAGRMDLYLERFDLRQMLDETVATVAPLVAKNDNELVTEFADDLGTIRADLTKVRQSLFNLLSNASKFSNEGTILLRAVKEQRDDCAWVLLSVRDTGIGIPKDKIDKVFEAFSQADESTTRDYGGTGLGLPISRRFCRMMGGDITVHSEPGEGSTFTIELPAKVDALEAAKAAAEAESEERAGIVDGPHPVLVIDDDPEARELLRRTLEADGLSVSTAGGGEEGLQLARTLNPLLITLDIEMPGMDGWAVLQELKGDSELKDIPVAMVSVVGDRGMGYALGAVEYLQKPVNRKELLRMAQHYADPQAGAHALIVEDDEPARVLMQKTLAESGWQVSEAENGAVALQRVAACTPDVILLDLMMPVMDGFEFVVELRKREEFRSIPIIVVTAKDLTKGDRDRLDGAVERIVHRSTFTREDLLQQIRNLAARCCER